MKEAAARIKINKLLEEAGWRFFADERGPANIQFESSVTLTTEALGALVAGNRELITRFEQKIQTTLARIWGEGSPT